MQANSPTQPRGSATTHHFAGERSLSVSEWRSHNRVGGFHRAKPSPRPSPKGRGSFGADARGVILTGKIQ
jgi:hypothetical protein